MSLDFFAGTRVLWLRWTARASLRPPAWLRRGSGLATAARLRLWWWSWRWRCRSALLRRGRSASASPQNPWRTAGAAALLASVLPLRRGCASGGGVGGGAAVLPCCGAAARLPQHFHCPTRAPVPAGRHSALCRDKLRRRPGHPGSPEASLEATSGGGGRVLLVVGPCGFARGKPRGYKRRCWSGVVGWAMRVCPRQASRLQAAEEVGCCWWLGHAGLPEASLEATSGGVGRVLLVGPCGLPRGKPRGYEQRWWLGHVGLPEATSVFYGAFFAFFCRIVCTGGEKSLILPL